MGGSYSDLMKKDVTPQWRSDPKFDPNYGFGNERKEREIKASLDEMAAAGVEPQFRDYCAHKLIDFYKCRRDNFPWVVACKHQLHDWDQCQYDDWVLRMKEYERERRLLARSERKASKLGSTEDLEG